MTFVGESLAMTFVGGPRHDRIPSEPNPNRIAVVGRNSLALIDGCVQCAFRPVMHNLW